MGGCIPNSRTDCIRTMKNFDEKSKKIFNLHKN